MLSKSFNVIKCVKRFNNSGSSWAGALGSGLADMGRDSCSIGCEFASQPTIYEELAISVSVKVQEDNFLF